MAALCALNCIPIIEFLGKDWDSNSRTQLFVANARRIDIRLCFAPRSASRELNFLSWTLLSGFELLISLNVANGLEVDGKMKVYLDDERVTPDGWKRVYWPDEAIELLKTGEVSDISLDHDLGDDQRGTGYDVILWIENAVATEGFSAPQIFVHSANSSARLKMEAGISAIQRLQERNQC